MPYDLSEHRHRFAAWAAARAAQRGFSTVDTLGAAIDKSGIRDALSDPNVLQLRSTSFDDLHRLWCGSICAELRKRGVANVTYGRAAKLIAVYLKTIVLMGDAADTPLGRTMHPPIDRTLLQALASSTASPHKTAWRTVSWTQLTQAEYFILVGELRSLIPAHQPFWILEEYWKAPEQDG